MHQSKLRSTASLEVGLCGFAKRHRFSVWLFSVFQRKRCLYLEVWKMRPSIVQPAFTFSEYNMYT